MSKIRVTKEFNFEMAHALWNYDGDCKNIHGHSYRLFITVIGEPNSKINNPKLGMVIDFGDLKSIINNEIVHLFDHAIVLNSNISDKLSIKNIKQMFDKTIYVNYQPTCENLVIDIVEKIKNKLPENVCLYRVRLYETAVSYAEWVITDNEDY